jgi:hypothetical protein
VTRKGISKEGVDGECGVWERKGCMRGGGCGGCGGWDLVKGTRRVKEVWWWWWW